jgi:hypothetical protein
VLDRAPINEGAPSWPRRKKVSSRVDERRPEDAEVTCEAKDWCHEDRKEIEANAGRDGG